jgi:hypothetical protein
MVNVWLQRIQQLEGEMLEAASSLLGVPAAGLEGALNLGSCNSCPPGNVGCSPFKQASVCIHFYLPPGSATWRGGLLLR